jgi:hypothetical protein
MTIKLTARSRWHLQNPYKLLHTRTVYDGSLDIVESDRRWPDLYAFLPHQEELYRCCEIFLKKKNLKGEDITYLQLVQSLSKGPWNQIKATLSEVEVNAVLGQEHLFCTLFHEFSSRYDNQINYLMSQLRTHFPRHISDEEIGAGNSAVLDYINSKHYEFGKRLLTWYNFLHMHGKVHGTILRELSSKEVFEGKFGFIRIPYVEITTSNQSIDGIG